LIAARNTVYVLEFATASSWHGRTDVRSMPDGNLDAPWSDQRWKISVESLRIPRMKKPV